jgi:FG-GAP-like repeat
LDTSHRRVCNGGRPACSERFRTLVFRPNLNGNGLPDVLITGSDLENSQVLLNNGDGTFKAGVTVLENGPSILMDGGLADLNWRWM